MTTEKKIRILVAEDETIIRLDLVEMLTEAGYEVVAQQRVVLLLLISQNYTNLI